MEILFKLCKHGSCGVSITGLEKENQQYLTDFSQELGKFTYMDTVSVNILIPVDSKDNEGKYEYTVKEHLEDDLLDQTIMEFPKDGLYKVVHMIIPNKSWKDNYQGDEYEIIYYYHEGNFYNEQDELIDLDLILNTNSELISVFYDYQLTFSSCQLQECYYKYANKFLLDYCSSGKCYNKQNSAEFDIIWIGMHVMKYLLDLNRLYEAQYILERLTSCTGVCYQQTKNKLKGNGCGC